MIVVNEVATKQREMKMTMAKSLCEQANLLEKEDKLTDAILLYEKAYRYCIECKKRDLDDADELAMTAAYHLACVHWQEINFGKALQYCKISLRACRRFADSDAAAYLQPLANTLETLGTIYMTLRDCEHEIECYTELLPLYRALGHRGNDSSIFQYVDVLSRIAFAHRKSKRYDLAKAEYHELIALLDREEEQHFEHRELLLAVAYEDLGRLYMDLEDYLYAQGYLNKAIKTLTPSGKKHCGDLARMLDCKAHCLLKFNKVGGNMASILALADKAIKLDPANADWYDTRGQVLLRMGDREGALKMWDKVMEIEPNHLEIGGSDLYDALFPETNVIKPIFAKQY